MMDQKAIKEDGYYELPLPLKDEDIRLPNNRAAVMKRLVSLKRKFEKDDPKIINRKITNRNSSRGTIECRKRSALLQIKSKRREHN